MRRQALLDIGDLATFQRMGFCVLQVSNPNGVLDESHTGALQAAASLFSLEAGGPENGASLEVASYAPIGRGGGRFGSSYRGGGRSVAFRLSSVDALGL